VRVFVLAAGAVFAMLLHGQFGGIINRAKQAVEKAKPVTDRAQKAIENYTPWTAEEEQQIGEATAAKMVAMFGLLEAPALVRYVNLVGSAVAQFAPRQVPYRFAILDTDIVGAFALPGGFIFVTRTALEGMNDESQLAGALGHEIFHVSERHLEKEIRSKNNSSWAIQEAKAVRAGPELLRAQADAIVKDLFDMRLSRDKEDAADSQGTLLAAQAGYAAGGLREFLRTLERVQNTELGKRAFGQLLSTHPPFKDRIDALGPVVQRAGTGGATLEARFKAAIQ
jgi:predicted Zn-dependent protease